jgi:hypothetical protein
MARSLTVGGRLLQCSANGTAAHLALAPQMPFV